MPLVGWSLVHCQLIGIRNGNCRNAFANVLPGAEQQRQMFGAGAAGVGHVDMRIGAVGDQRVRMLHHFGRDVGVQIEADDQRQILADHLAHARQDFAFAVVEMLGRPSRRADRDRRRRAVRPPRCRRSSP